ncbi:hypothetical protein D5086_012224 [Populus alba]|uniref:Uncharacterized protein n=1 Tax=Populus alba TaxID=43335 RepID=A0ACC4C2T4_POPAL
MTLTKSIAEPQTNGGLFKALLCLDPHHFLDVNMDLFFFFTNSETNILVLEQKSGGTFHCLSFGGLCVGKELEPVLWIPNPTSGT